MMWDAYGGMGFGGIGMLLFWGVVIVGIAALVRWLAGGPGRGRGPDAGEILKARYARGEISREQFEQLKRDIGVG